jgi:hypothetical protein
MMQARYRAAICLSILASVGCAGHDQGTNEGVSEWGPTMLAFDDDRSSPEERQAILAASQAVLGTASPSREVRDPERLRFDCTKTYDGWLVMVMQCGANGFPTKMGFVNLGDDYIVRGEPKTKLIDKP